MKTFYAHLWFAIKFFYRETLFFLLIHDYILHSLTTCILLFVSTDKADLWRAHRDEYKEFEKLIQDDLQEIDNRLEEEEARLSFPTSI